MDPIAELLDAIAADDEGSVESWVQCHGDVRSAWLASEDAAALVALAYRTVPDEVIVGAGIACARQALALVDELARERCARVVRLAERYCGGNASGAELQVAAARLASWAGDLDRPLLSGQVGEATARACDAARAPRAVQMVARALAYGELGVRPDATQGDYVSSDAYLSEREQLAFQKALGALASVVRERVECPTIEAVRARKLD